MIAKAQRLAGNLANVELRVASAEDIPYPDETFDAALAPAPSITMPARSRR
jgi:ubiquinone/menaquinone biosynthesis C-methylase UbiE